MMTETRYHVYVNNKCIYHSLTESEFHETWRTLNKLIHVIGDVKKEDISYEKVIFSKDLSTNSSY